MVLHILGEALNKVIKKFILVCLLVLMSESIPAKPVTAQASDMGLEMLVEANFDGNFKYGEWLPLMVSLENNGPNKDVRVQTQITQTVGQVTFAKDVSLPTGSRKQITLYILPNNYSREIDVQLITEEIQVMSRIVEVVPNQNDHFIVGIASPQWGPLTQISSIQFSDSNRSPVLVNLNLDNLPDQPVGLNSLDAIILNDVDTSQLDDNQKSALDSWVRVGGHLILGGGSGIIKLHSGLPKTLASFEPGEQREVSELTNLESFSHDEKILLTGPFFASSVTYQGGSSLILAEEMPILHQWTVGGGKVTFSALNLTDSPFNAWSGTPAFWENLLASDTYYPVWLPRDMSIRQMRASSMTYPLSNLPVLDLPSIQGLGILLVFYILLIGPTNYFVLKKQNKLHLAWITIPVLTAIFSLGAFGLAIGLRGNDIMTNKLSVISLRQDGLATIDSYIGVFSPAQESFEIMVSGNMLLSPSANGYYDPWVSAAPATVGETVFVQDNPARVVGLNINQWSMQSFNSENISVQMGKITSELVMSAKNIKGEIQNQLDTEILDGVLVIGDQIVPIGSLEPGEEIQVNYNLTEQPVDLFRGSLTYQILDTTHPTGGFEYSRDYELKRSILDNIYQPYGYWIGPKFESAEQTNDQELNLSNVYLLGWLSDAPPEISINGKESTQNTLALLTTHIPVRIDKGNYSIPASLIEGEIVKQPLNGGYCGGASTHVYMDFGSSEFEYHIPKTLLATQIDQLVIGYYEEISQWNEGNSGVTLSVYNWEEQGWFEIANLTNGKNILENDTGFINQLGTVRIQIEKEAQNPGGCMLVSLGLEGSNP